MIHRITLHFLILNDYARRAVFPRYRAGGQHAMMDDISAKVSSDELRAILADAEANTHLHALSYPNLVMAYSRLAKKAREMLRAEPDFPDIGRDGKSAAAGKDD